MVSKRELVSQDESAWESCLHCEINDLVEEHIEGQETVDIAEVAARMAESLEKSGVIAGDANTVQ
jgi:hypothetical protein